MVFRLVVLSVGLLIRQAEVAGGTSLDLLSVEGSRKNLHKKYKSFVKFLFDKPLPEMPSRVLFDLSLLLKVAFGKHNALSDGIDQ